MLRFVTDTEIPRIVKVWLTIGAVMVVLQIVIGGITRLTGSGLSITRWEVVTGTLPPLSAAEWETAFDLYKQTPQYEKINQGMSLGDFKFIYFWEYFHRLWARLMFFVFIVPFGWFLARGMFSRRLLPRLVTVVLLAGLEGFFGWAMVASGLIKRPWVNAYNLTLHLTMGLVIFAYLLWTAFVAYQPHPSAAHASERHRRFAWVVVLLAFFQIALGAMMSGSKAGLFYPTWPDMNGAFVPDVLFDGSQWRTEHFLDYDTNPFMPALIQFLHRNTAYILSALIVWFWWQLRGAWPSEAVRKGMGWVLAILGVQVLLGVLTLINCKGHIPVLLGVLHQGGAVLLLAVLLFVAYQFSKKFGSSNNLGDFGPRN